LRNVIGAATKGAIVGGAAGFTGGASLLVSTGAVSGATIFGGIADRTIQGKRAKEVLNLKEVAKDGISGAVGGVLGGKVEKAGESLATSYSGAVKEMIARPGTLAPEDIPDAMRIASTVGTNKVLIGKAAGKGLDLAQTVVENAADRSKKNEKPPDQKEPK
jgi:hypothetical protein